jgi:hypothetical protein
MKLKYRGVSYDSMPTPTRAIATGLTGKYRGVFYPIQSLETEEPVPQPVAMLKYRGVPYSIGQSPPTEVEESIAAMVPTIAAALIETQILRLKYQFHHPIESN